MFCRDKAVHPERTLRPKVEPLINSLFGDFIQRNNFSAGFLCIWDEDSSSAHLIASSAIPDTPFKGAKRDVLASFVRTCLERYPAPHPHSISDSPLWPAVSSLINTERWHHRAIFLPAYSLDTDFVILGFQNASNEPAVTNELLKSTEDLINLTNFLLSTEKLDNRLRVMEVYVREIGHDIASSVQAIISKLRNVHRGLITGPAALAKVKEAEAEIMSTYRVAEALGITVDPDYNIGTGHDFDAATAIRSTLDLVRSEAEERHIEFRFEDPGAPLTIWGDEKAIQSAVLQLLLNAIKYARGSSYISIRVGESNGNVEFSVTDRGKPLTEDEAQHMWEFGWRGEKAKELHVNGSGIGLYTVKKVVQAHGGTVGSRSSESYQDIVTVFFRIPRKDIFRKSRLY